ncbi:iron-sulfur cluster carrier protein ApbC [Rheinheimera sp. 1928-s]|uniref:iron-sulfur cluster carrier protein ApbC n=1 Tax=Rheinheimera sp. 1928-s TaxID=3033803 RepID=UPI002625A11A|nr:iron-sulfur cluster carrier protein ApbC [Rheinheimera sp. 1928-s]MDF3126571.1 iron-sulfur cluster carrier protein ApbC [Rheinheimera sp. 1928-s]
MWFKWFKKAAEQQSAADDMPEALAKTLAEFQSNEFPMPLDSLIQQASFNTKQNSLSLTLKFPWASLADELLPVLQQVQPDLRLELNSENTAEPAYRNIKQVILVASGKGGVGKSTTAVNLAVALGLEGAKVGLLDADIYGPSIPTMLGLKDAKAESPDDKHLLPKEAAGIYLQSIGFLVDPEKASVWRGPMASQALLQLLNETLWPDLDYLIVDMPPGTGDIQLTMSQKLPVTGALIVTTPQDVALADAQKAIAMFRSVNIPVLGLVENMSFYQCSHCGEIDDIFGTNGGLDLAERYQVPVLGQLPLQKQIRQSCDAGTPLVLNPAESGTGFYRAIARQLSFALYWNSQHQQAQQPEIIFTDD